MTASVAVTAAYCLTDTPPDAGPERTIKQDDPQRVIAAAQRLAAVSARPAIAGSAIQM